MDAQATYTLTFADQFSAGARGATDAARELAAQLKMLQTASGQSMQSVSQAARGATGALTQVGGATRVTGAASGGASLNLRALAKAFRSSGAEGGAFASKGLMLVNVLKRLITSPVGVAAAVVVLTLALVAGAVAFAHWALSAADAARSQDLLVRAATGSNEASSALNDQIDQLADSTALSSAKLREMGIELARAGLAGAALGSTFDAAAIAASTMGDAAGSKIKSFAEEAVKAKRFALQATTLQGTGVGLDDVAAALAGKFHVSLAAAKSALQSGTVKVQDGLDALDSAVNKKLGGIAKAQSIGLSVQMARLHDNIGKLFAGLNIEPFLAALHDLLSVFDQSTVSGKGLAAAMKGIAQPLIEGITALMPLGKAFFQGLIIAALMVAIVVLKIRNAIRDTFGGAKAPIDSVALALTAGKIAGYGLAIVLGVIAVALGLAAVAAVLFAAVFIGPFVLAGYAVYKLYGVIVDAMGAAKAYLSGLDFGQIATDLVNGLVNGIKAGAAWVVDAVIGLGSAAMKALKSTLGIHSPSLVFQGYGQFTAQGFAEGVEDETPRVRRSVASMVETPPDVGRAGRGGGGRTLVFRDNKLEFHGVKDAGEIQSDDFFTKLAMALEKLTGETGAQAPEPEGAT